MKSAEIRADVPVQGFTLSWAKKIVLGTLAYERVGSFAVDVLLTGDKSIRKINKKYLNHDYATDVIAFNLEEELGGVVVSVERARLVAKELKIPFKEELARYLVHGTLHLLGYEDKPKKNYEKMRARQEKILEKMGFDT